MADCCLPKITEMINRLDGLNEERMVPRIFYQESEGLAQQLSLFEETGEYDLH